MMKQAFTARVFQEGNWFVAQCLEVDVAGTVAKTKSQLVVQCKC